MTGTTVSSDMWDDVKWHRYGLLAGVVFVVLEVISFFAPGAPPSRDASADEITKYFVDNASGIKLGAILVAIAMIFGVWWLGSLWRVIGRLEPSGPRLAFIAAAGFILSGAISAVGQAVFVAPALRPDTLGGTAEFVWSVGYSAYAMTMATLAVHLLALGALALWTKFVPSWLGYVAMVAALAAAVATIGVGTEASAFVVFQIVAFLGWLVWVLVASVLLYRTTSS
jgi:hypothetical protein